MQTPQHEEVTGGGRVELMEEKVGVEEMSKNKRKKRKSHKRKEVMVEDGHQLMEYKVADENTDTKKQMKKQDMSVKKAK